MDDEEITITIKVWAETNRVGSRNETSFTMPKDEWEEMSEKQRDEICQEALWDLIDRTTKWRDNDRE